MGRVTYNFLIIQSLLSLYNINLGNIFNLSDFQLLLNPKLVEKVAAEDQRVARRVDRVDPTGRDEERVAGL